MSFLHVDVKERTLYSQYGFVVIEEAVLYVTFGVLRLELGMVGLAGLEPATPRLSSACSNQLSYRPVWIP